MKFRPCIDLHDGVVKQIVGSTLSESNSTNVELIENFVSNKEASEYANIYKSDNLFGGHIIMLGPNNQEVAMNALRKFPMGLQIGGGINAKNACDYINAGASHVIITSYVFEDGQIQFDRLKEISSLVGKDKLVLDLSCRRKQDDSNDELYYVVTNKWTKYTNYPITPENLNELSEYCDEFLVHGVEVEGKRCGIEESLVSLLGKHSPIPVTYAGGIRSIEDIELLEILGNGRVDFTVGSALDLFGGDLSYHKVLEFHQSRNT